MTLGQPGNSIANVNDNNGQMTMVIAHKWAKKQELLLKAICQG